MEQFRVKYLDYVKSEPIQTEHGTSYHVDFAEHEGAPKVGWQEKFSGRDFGIGGNVGALIGTIWLWSSTAAAGVSLEAIKVAAMAIAPQVFGLTVLCAAIGGVSDYVRHTNQMEKGMNINPPSYFNRDLILNGLGVSSTVGMVAGIGMMGLTFVGAGVAAPVAMAINIAAFVGGMIYGGADGAKEGYGRMEAEYTAAKRKYEDPSYHVMLSQKRETQFDEIISNEAALAATILPLVVPALAQTDAPSNKVASLERKHTAPAHNLVETRAL